VSDGRRFFAPLDNCRSLPRYPSMDRVLNSSYPHLPSGHGFHSACLQITLILD
jgi:hypothetical protein